MAVNWDEWMRQRQAKKKRRKQQIIAGILSLIGLLVLMLAVPRCQTSTFPEIADTQKTDPGEKAAIPLQTTAPSPKISRPRLKLSPVQVIPWHGELKQLIRKTIAAHRCQTRVHRTTTLSIEFLYDPTSQLIRDVSLSTLEDSLPTELQQCVWDALRQESFPLKSLRENNHEKTRLSLALVFH